MIRYSGVILAGGTSKRMGRDKRFLRVEGRPLVAWVADRVRPLVDEVLVVAREPGEIPPVDARLVADQYPGMGVLAGVHAGLAAARGDWAYVLAGDMPHIDPALLRALAGLAGPECDLIVPRWRGELEPLHALYRPAACAPAAEAALRRGQRRIVAFYPAVRVCEMPEREIAKIDPEGKSFFNVNTPEDWEKV